MSQATGSENPERRLKLLRFAFLLITALTVAIVAGVNFLFLTPGNALPAVVQGVLWGALVAVGSAVVYFVYKRAVLKM